VRPGRPADQGQRARGGTGASDLTARDRGSQDRKPSWPLPAPGYVRQQTRYWKWGDGNEYRQTGKRRTWNTCAGCSRKKQCWIHRLRGIGRVRLSAVRSSGQRKTMELTLWPGRHEIIERQDPVHEWRVVRLARPGHPLAGGRGCRRPCRLAPDGRALVQRGCPPWLALPYPAFDTGRRLTMNAPTG